jgi:hypothetical protein
MKNEFNHSLQRHRPNIKRQRTDCLPTRDLIGDEGCLFEVMDIAVVLAHQKKRVSVPLLRFSLRRILKAKFPESGGGSKVEQSDYED